LRALALASAFALAALAAGCSESPCQELGERLCACTGQGSGACEAQVEDQLDGVDLTEGRCEEVLGACAAPEGVDFCEWLLTAAGKTACGFTPAP
jgi:hypothetical protein